VIHESPFCDSRAFASEPTDRQARMTKLPGAIRYLCHKTLQYTDQVQRKRMKI